MLCASGRGENEAEAPVGVRFSAAETLAQYLAGESPRITTISTTEALEESYFLGLRLNSGISPQEIAASLGTTDSGGYKQVISELVTDSLLEYHNGRLRLTAQGRLLSNEVFGRFLIDKLAIPDQATRRPVAS
jgi:oxygen-independent coproporphyrinogen-3 oxidase